MGKHSIEATAAQLVAEESPLRRYKGTILIIATGVVAILTQLADSADWQGTTVGTILTAIVTAASALLNRFTRDAMTPSMAPRMEAAFGEPDARV